jgi:hypothetical protein
VGVCLGGSGWVAGRMRVSAADPGATTRKWCSPHWQQLNAEDETHLERGQDVICLPPTFILLQGRSSLFWRVLRLRRGSVVVPSATAASAIASTGTTITASGCSCFACFEMGPRTIRLWGVWVGGQLFGTLAAAAAAAAAVAVVVARPISTVVGISPSRRTAAVVTALVVVVVHGVVAAVVPVFLLWRHKWAQFQV